jgi:hypothetical protein
VFVVSANKNINTQVLFIVFGLCIMVAHKVSYKILAKTEPFLGGGDLSDVVSNLNSFINNTSNSLNNASATGGYRSNITPLQTMYNFAADILTEEISWKIIDSPHDALMDINNTFAESGGDANHGYRCRNVTWYRKRFTLPNDWNTGGGIIYLRFEGVMHFTQFWLNGLYLVSHSATYDEFTIRLDNVSSIRLSSNNSVDLQIANHIFRLNPSIKLLVC